MIAGEFKVFVGEQEGAAIDKAVLVDLCEWGEYLELAFEDGKKRTYIRFRYADLKREIKELTA